VLFVSVSIEEEVDDDSGGGGFRTKSAIHDRKRYK
jgi:hypothetical protein